MTIMPTPETMNRTAKLFMDRGEAADYDTALARLQGFRLGIACGREVLSSPAHQCALLTVVNAGRRTFLGGIHVELPGDAPLLVPLADAPTLGEAVFLLGGRLKAAGLMTPRLLIGSVDGIFVKPSWQVTWDGWRGGVIPSGERMRLAEHGTVYPAPMLAGAIALSEAFRYFDGRPFAGKRAVGVSLWDPLQDWCAGNSNEPPLCFLPSSLFLLGLGNLGQAYLPDAGGAALCPGRDARTGLAGLR